MPQIAMTMKLFENFKPKRWRATLFCVTNPPCALIVQKSNTVITFSNKISIYDFYPKKLFKWTAAFFCFANPCRWLGFSPTSFKLSLVSFLIFFGVRVLISRLPKVWWATFREILWKRFADKFIIGLLRTHNHLSQYCLHLLHW